MALYLHGGAKVESAQSQSPPGREAQLTPDGALALTESLNKERERGKELARMVGDLLEHNEKLALEVRRLKAEKQEVYSDLHITLQASLSA